MAEQQLNIKLNVIDNATKAFKSVKDSIFNLRTALLGIGSGAVVKSILNVGSQAQRLKNQFLLLSPSIEEGKKSFEALQKFTATSPLQSDSIERASEIVVIFSKNSQELTDNLFAIQNAAIALGIDIETVAREFSSLSRTGIEGARELKRRNLESFLGLRDGVKLSSEEITRLFLKTFGKGGTFELASDAFGNTFAGATNRFKNSIKQIQESIAQGGVLDFFTDALNVFSDFVRENPEALKKVIDNFAIGLIEGTKALFSFTTRIIELLKLPFEIVVDGIKGLNDIIDKTISSNPVIKELGIIGFLLLGRRGKLIAILLGKLFKDTQDSINELGGTALENQTEQTNKLFDIDDFYAKINQKAQERLEKENQFLKKLQEQKEKGQEILSNFEKLLGLFSQLNRTAITNIESLSSFANLANQTITDFSKTLAEIIVLGKNLSGTFREFLQSILVKILATTIDYIVRLYIIQPILDKILGTERDRTKEQSKQTVSLLENLGINYLDLDIHKQKIEAIKEQNSLLQSQLVVENGIVAARAAQSSYGRGGGGGGFDLGTIFNFASSFFAEGGQVQAGQPYMVGERGRELFVPQTDGTIVPNQDLGGGTNINFTINATDVRGVKELLLNNRATITNIVNQALNAKGKSNLV